MRRWAGRDHQLAALAHATFCVNSVLNVWGTRPFATKDASRNNALIALLVLGEGWHNNHHRYPGSARQGFHWWQVDVTWYVLVMLSWFGLVSRLRSRPI